MLDKYPLETRTEYTDEEFCEALEKYRNQDIKESIASENPLLRMFAVLGRKIGKRTLIKEKRNYRKSTYVAEAILSVEIQCRGDLICIKIGGGFNYEIFCFW